MERVNYQSLAAIAFLFLPSLVSSGEPLEANGLHRIEQVAAQEYRAEEVPCEKPYLKVLRPKAAKVGDQLILRGHRFGSEEGKVVFEGNVSGEVVFWRIHRVSVRVPLGAISGLVRVVSACGRASNGEYFNVKSAQGEEKSTGY